MIELPLEVAGQQLWLHAERAVWWSAQSTLLVADVHLGKGHVLRRAGIAVPTGQTLADLDRFDALIAHYRPQRLIVLGDLIHGHADEQTPWVSEVRAWRARHAALHMLLVAGNHDRHFDTRLLGFENLPAPWPLPPFALCHEPARVAGYYALAGHVHPAAILRDGWRRHRLPAFRFGPDTGLLPAFGTLTGLHAAAREDGERIIAVTPVGLVQLADA